jgi:hypothetical protein
MNDPAQAFRGAVWYDVVLRSAACPHLPPRVLLHAGPPYRGPPYREPAAEGTAPAPVVNAAVQAILFEGWASDERAAIALLNSGGAVLQPAQDHGVVTPLAQVVSPSMPLAAVRSQAEVRYGAVLEGAGPALRFGSRAPDCRERLRLLSFALLGEVAPLLRRAPVALAEPIRRGVAHGEDCHSRTATVNAELLDGIVGVAVGLKRTLQGMSAFVLPILMAAASAAMAEATSAVAAIGANGIECGLKYRGEHSWRRLPALPPAGERLPGRETSIPLPAIGDSIVIDYCGLGGLLDAPQSRAALLDPHSGMIDPRRVGTQPSSTGIGTGIGSPVFNLAILDAVGEHGLIGRGTYRPDPSLFSSPD